MATRTPKTKATTAKPTTKKATAAAKPAEPAAEPPKTDAAPVPQMKFKDVVEQVVDRTGQRKGEVRTALQAALGVMGDAIAAGKELNLQPLGKLSVNRTKDTPRGQVHMVKVVQITKSAEPDSPDADDAAKDVAAS